MGVITRSGGTPPAGPAGCRSSTRGATTGGGQDMEGADAVAHGAGGGPNGVFASAGGRAAQREFTRWLRPRGAIVRMAARRAWRRVARRAAGPRPDPPLVRMRERWHADQRAAGAPRRRRSRCRGDRRAVPATPGPVGRSAGEAARRGGRHAVPGDGCPPPGQRRRGPASAARSRRGSQRRPGQEPNPGQHDGGAHRRRTRGRRPRRCRRDGPADL
jgi:hypothetical protein